MAALFNGRQTARQMKSDKRSAVQADWPHQNGHNQRKIKKKTSAAIIALSSNSSAFHLERGGRNGGGAPSERQSRQKTGGWEQSKRLTISPWRSYQKCDVFAPNKIKNTSAAAEKRRVFFVIPSASSNASPPPPPLKPPGPPAGINRLQTSQFRLSKILRSNYCHLS